MSDAATSQGAGGRPASAAAGPAGDASVEPLTGGLLLAAGLVLSVANFMAVLDTTVANVSVPTIAGGLGVSASEGTWVITSYSVAEAITVPLTGWLAGRFGSVRVFVTAMGCFGLFSALCGLAPSLSVLVVFRVLQGLCGGPMIPLSQTLLLRVFPPNRAAQALGLWGMTTVVAPIAGPILGGLICDNYSWPWVFYINVPVALTCTVLGWRMLKGHETPRKKASVDVVGLVLLVIWVGSLQIMLDKGEELDWFRSSFVVALALVAATGFLAFLIWELTDANPIVNLRVFSSRGYTIALFVLCLCFGSYFAGIVLLPLWLQTSLGFNATWAGYATAPVGIFSVIMAPIVARLMGRMDPRLLVFIGVLGLGGTMVWRSGFSTNIDFFHIVVPQFVQGVFTTLFFLPIFSLALGALKPQDIAGGAGLLSFARTMSAAVATSIATTAWYGAARSSRVQLLNQLDPLQAMREIASTGMSHARGLRMLDSQVQGQSVMLATDKLFLSLGVLMAVAAFSIWLTPRPKQRAGPAAAH